LVTLCGWSIKAGILREAKRQQARGILRGIEPQTAIVRWVTPASDDQRFLCDESGMGSACIQSVAVPGPRAESIMIAKPVPSSSWSAAVLVLASLMALWSSHARAEGWSGSTINGSGIVKSEARSVSGFHGLTLGVDARLEIRQGTTEGLSITGDDNIVPLIETVVDGGTLKIRWAGRRNYSTQYKNLEIVVNVIKVDALTVAGSGEIRAAQLKADDLRATVAGSGGIGIDKLEANAFKVNVAGSGDVAVAGRAESLDVTIAGSGNVKASRLESRSARIAINGSGDATVWATETLSATVAGSGDIKYYGKPQVKRTVAGSGTVSPAPAS
jgi:Putative auto-transporter adhesin, head GIN domain